jgi:hypothetical protein
LLAHLSLALFKIVMIDIGTVQVAGPGDFSRQSDWRGACGYATTRETQAACQCSQALAGND